MPQIAQIAATYASQIFWLLIIFGLILFGIGYGMFPKIQGTVEKRDQKIADDLAAAEAARETADATEEAYRIRMDAARAASQKAIQVAKAEAAAETEQKVKVADADLAAEAAAADARIAAAQAEALGGIEDVAADAAQEIVGKVSGIAVDRATAAQAVKTALAIG